MLGSLLSILIPTVGKVIDKAVPDRDMAKKLQHEISKELIANGHEIQKLQADIIKTEAGHSDKFVARWRPTLMYVAIAIIANNYLLAPYLEAMFNWSVMLDLPERLWDVLTIGIGGYVAGRSGEKMLGKYAEAKFSKPNK